MIKLSQKRTCEGCRALLQIQYIDRCELGYKFDDNFKPLQSCPKPKTNSEFIQCREIFKEVKQNETKM